MKCHVLSCSGCGMSCFACAGFICCSRFGHGAVHSLRPLEGRMTAAGLLLPRLRGRPGGGPLSRQRKRRAKPRQRSVARRGPSRGEARPRPLPPSGRGVCSGPAVQPGRSALYHPPAPAPPAAASLADEVISACTEPVLPHRLRPGPRRPARAFRPASPPVRGGGRLPSSFLLAPTGRGSLFRAYPARAPAPARARVCTGAVRAPDCAREAKGVPLPSVSHGFSESGAARPRNA